MSTKNTEFTIYSISPIGNNINSLWNNHFNTFRLLLKRMVISVSNITKVIGQRLRNERVKLGLSQEKLAEMAGCHPTYIGQIERGEKNPTIESLEKISNALEISLSQLFEKLGGKKLEKNVALDCYELISSKTEDQQEQIYKILLEMDKFSNN